MFEQGFMCTKMWIKGIRLIKIRCTIGTLETIFFFYKESFEIVFENMGKNVLPKI